MSKMNYQKITQMSHLLHILLSAHIILPKMIALVEMFSVETVFVLKIEIPKFIWCLCLSLGMMGNDWKFYVLDFFD